MFYYVSVVGMFKKKYNKKKHKKMQDTIMTAEPNGTKNVETSKTLYDTIMAIEQSIPIINSEKNGKKTILIMDWDDTFLPTTHLANLKLVCETPILQFQDHVWEEAKWHELETNIISTLDLLLSHESILINIVTNAEAGWVELSCQKFYPKLWQVIQEKQIEIFSARTMYECEHPNDPVAWKTAVMRGILHSESPMQMVSVGDSSTERLASHMAGKEHNCTVKSIKLFDSPVLDQLLVQWKLVSECFTDIYNTAGSLDLMMWCRPTSPELLEIK